MGLVEELLVYKVIQSDHLLRSHEQRKTVDLFVSTVLETGTPTVSVYMSLQGVSCLLHVCPCKPPTPSVSYTEYVKFRIRTEESRYVKTFQST